MTWRNDPEIGAIPKAGDGSVDIGRRTVCGEAVVYDGTNIDALVEFLGDGSLVAFEKQLYWRQDDGTLTPANLAADTVVLKPPAGNWFTVDKDALMQEYAIVVHVPDQLHGTGSKDTVTRTMPTGTIKHTVDLGTAKPAKKAAPAKAAAKKAAAKK